MKPIRESQMSKNAATEEFVRAMEAQGRKVVRASDLPTGVRGKKLTKVILDEVSTFKPKPIRESQIEKYLVEQVKAKGGMCRKVKFINHNGAPDRVLFFPPYTDGVYARTIPAFWVELKAPGKKPTTQQLREHERMRGMGQQVEVIDSFEGVDRLLQEMRL